MATILVIEPDAHDRELLSRQLQANGHEVTTAEDSVAGIKALLSERPDIIISPINMPYINGVELLQAIRGDALTKSIPLIFLTTGERHDWSEAIKLGVSGYVNKPIRTDELMAEIDWALINANIHKYFPELNDPRRETLSTLVQALRSRSKS